VVSGQLRTPASHADSCLARTLRKQSGDSATGTTLVGLERRAYDRSFQKTTLVSESEESSITTPEPSQFHNPLVHLPGQAVQEG
jgi:hypothetical protein